MKTLCRKALAFILACCLAISMCCFASATGVEGRGSELPDPDVGGATHTTITTVSCSSLTGETYSTKITKSGLPSSATKIGVTGTIKHSVGSGHNAYTMRAGIGYFRSSSSNIQPEYYRSYKTGSEYVYFTSAISGLSSTTNYYAFIKNMAPSYGTVSGSIDAFTLG